MYEWCMNGSDIKNSMYYYVSYRVVNNIFNQSIN